jgi:hypothetical protein
LSIYRNRHNRRTEKDIYYRAISTNCIQITDISQIAYIIITAILIVKERCGNVRKLVKGEGRTNTWKYPYLYLCIPTVCCVSKIAAYLSLIP